jgi:hypothetical protein
MGQGHMGMHDMHQGMHPAPQQSAADTFFPPGLIPQLAKAANHGIDRLNGYAAINPNDVPPSVPPPGAHTDYFQERLRRYYDDLRDGGMSRKVCVCGCVWVCVL